MGDTVQLTVSVPSEAVFSWESQASQLVPFGRDFDHPDSTVVWNVSANADDAPPGIWAVLHYDPKGNVDGILFFYAENIALEKAGNFNIWVRGDRQRKGVGLALLEAADERFGLDFEQQRYTPAGARLAQAYIDRKGKA